jgi:hypothetical protein
MKTIQIPSNIVNRDNNAHVPPNCKVKLTFIEAGSFSRSADGDDFSPVLPSGEINVSATYVCAAPPYDVNVRWRFTPDDPSKDPTMGNILVDEGGRCSDTPAPSPSY